MPSETNTRLGLFLVNYQANQKLLISAVAMADLRKEHETPDTFTAIATQANGTEQSGLAEEHDSILPSSHDDDHDLGHNKLAASESYGINSSVNSTAEITQPQTKAWYRKLNPLRWGIIPPIPDNRIVSPEYKAGFLSLLIFDWITPMMVVSCAPCTSFREGCGPMLITY